MALEVWLIIGGIALVALMIWGYVQSTGCGKCGKYFAKVVDKKNSIGTRTAREIVETKKQRYGSNPPIWDTKFITYEMTFTNFLHECRCKYCGEKWHEEHEKQTDKRKVYESP